METFSIYKQESVEPRRHMDELQGEGKEEKRAATLCKCTQIFLNTYAFLDRR